MRIVSGYLKGSKIIAPKGLKTRPTSDRVKEAIFNVLGEITNAYVLDLYAGSGNLTFEALSRGAKKAVLIDKSRQATEAILKNAKKLNLEDKIKVIHMAVDKVIKKFAEKRAFDLIFADPPYNITDESALELIRDIKNLALLSEEGIMVFELSAKKDLKQTELRIDKIKKYGDTKIYFLSR